MKLAIMLRDAKQPPPQHRPTKNIDEVEQHGGAHKPCYARPPQNGVARHPKENEA